MQPEDGSWIFGIRCQGDSSIRRYTEVLARRHVTEAQLLFPAYHVACMRRQSIISLQGHYGCYSERRRSSSPVVVVVVVVVVVAVVVVLVKEAVVVVFVFWR